MESMLHLLARTGPLMPAGLAFALLGCGMLAFGMRRTRRDEAVMEEIRHPLRRRNERDTRRRRRTDRAD